MNIALEQTEEYVNGQLTNSYGDAFIRGNNGSFFSASSREGASLTELTLINLIIITPVLYISKLS